MGDKKSSKKSRWKLWLWIGVGVLILAAIGSTMKKKEDSKKKSGKSTEKAPTWVAPKKGPLVDRLEVARNETGGVVVSGTSRLPPGTKIWVTVHKRGSKRTLGTAKVFVSDAQDFSTTPFTNQKRPHSSGRYELEVTSIFNGAWQTQKILELVGRGGRKLPASALVPDDKEFPNAGGRVEILKEVTFPQLPQSAVAIEAVKRARLFVKGSGRSHDEIEGVVALFLKTKQFKPPYSWRASRKKGTSVWIVKYRFDTSSEDKIPAWSYDAKTKKVRYHNHAGKLWSWSPNY